MLKIGLFTFGGGYAMIALLENEFVEKKGYLEKDEFLDMVAIAESTPGPIAINAATYIGYKQLGFLGALVATVATYRAGDTATLKFVRNHQMQEVELTFDEKQPATDDGQNQGEVQADPGNGQNGQSVPDGGNDSYYYQWPFGNFPFGSMFGF